MSLEKRPAKRADSVVPGPIAWLILLSVVAPLGTLVFLFKRTDVLEPDVAWVLQRAAWTWVQVALIGIGILGARIEFARAVGRSVTWIGVSLALAGVVQWVQMAVNAPVYSSLHEDRRTRDGFVLQTTDTSCTAAALANALILQGRQTTERECAERLGTTRFGSTTGALRQAVSKLGAIGIFVEASPSVLLGMGHPALLTTICQGVRHSVTWYGEDAHGLELLVDPLEGRLRITKAALQRELADRRAFVVKLRVGGQARGAGMIGGAK